MSPANWLRYFHAIRFSRPAADREICRLLYHARVRRIIEIGIVDLQRTVRLLSLARRLAADETLQYAGLDMFDARQQALPPLKLIETHRALQATKVGVRLVPGPYQSTVAGIANSYADTDLILLAPWIDGEQMGRAWLFFPRMLHAHTAILWRTGDPDDRANRWVSHEEIKYLSGQYGQRQAA